MHIGIFEQSDAVLIGICQPCGQEAVYQTRILQLSEDGIRHVGTYTVCTACFEPVLDQCTDDRDARG